jgi:acetate kinase
LSSSGGPASADASAVLVINAGSSSLKFGLYQVHAGTERAMWSGQFEGLQPGGKVTLHLKGAPPQAVPMLANSQSADIALAALASLLTQRGVVPLAVAHRIVHGGTVCVDPCVLTDSILEQLAALAPLAPLHQPFNLAGVRAMRALLPQVPQVGCFDTAFHAGMPAVEQRLPIAHTLHSSGIRRYGFHGLSYEHMRGVLHNATGSTKGRWLLAHLGSGASLCALLDGEVRATTMGFSALDGLMMGSRCGALDPGVLLHLWRQGRSLDEVEKLLWRESGLLGVSGESGDMRVLRTSAQQSAQDAIELFCHRLLREAGAMMACLGGLDLIAFTGGIGEHDADVRATLAAGLGFTGLKLDKAANTTPQLSEASLAARLHADTSLVQAWVVRCDEGSVAARAARSLAARMAKPG